MLIAVGRSLRLLYLQARMKLRTAYQALNVQEERCDGGFSEAMASGYDSEDEAERARVQAAELAALDRTTLKVAHDSVHDFVCLIVTFSLSHRSFIQSPHLA